MNNICKENNDVSSLKTIFKNEKKNNLLSLSAADRNVKDEEKSAFQKELLLKIKDELSEIDCKFSKNIVQSDSNIPPLKKVKASKSVKKKKSLKSADNLKKVHIKTINLNKNTSSESSSNSATNDDSNSLLSCQFCERKFESVEDLSSHKCKKDHCDIESNIYKCEFCCLTFSKKDKLNRHMLGHNRNNCTICSANFTKRKALCKHLKFEHNIVEPEKLHPCSFCSKNFCNKSSLNTHLKTHANGQHFCRKCGFMCDSEDVYNDHVKEHIENSKYECELCGKKFVRRQQHDQHMMGHERHLCSVCNITYSTKKLLLKHCQSEHGACISVKKHECPICKKLFLRPKHLQTHQRSHTGEKRVKCHYCEKLFCDEKSLSKHMKTVKHLKQVNMGEGEDIKIEKPFLCSECGARFYRKQSLLRHAEVKHSAIESFKCSHCDYNTKCKTNYKRHLELHTNVKRFVCEICGSSFRAFASLKEHHAFVHSESRDFICGVCNKGFKNKSTLLRHSRIHSEVRPYKCYCDRDYKRMSHLKRHMLSAHRMTFKKNPTSGILESTNLEAGDKTENLASALELLPDESSCDEFSFINVPDSGTLCAELKDPGLKENSNNEQLCVSTGDVNFTAVPSSTIQTLFNKSIPDEGPKSTLASLVSKPCEKTPLCLPPDPDTSSSMSLDDPNLNLSPNNFCDFNLSSSPLSSLPMDNPTSTLVQSMASQDVLSFPSSDSLNRPHSLPNLNFQTPVSSIDSFTHFSLQNSNSPTSPQIPSFLLSGDIPSPSHIVDLNLDQNCTPKQLFGDSYDILSLPTYMLSNQLSGVNCNTSQFLSPVRDLELWDTVDCSNKLKISDSELATTTTSCASFSTNLTSNSCNLLAHNLLSSNDTFEDPTLMSYSLEHISLNPGFDALSNLC